MSLAADQLVGTWRLEGDRLVLTADEGDAARGLARRHVIEWRRAGCADT